MEGMRALLAFAVFLFAVAPAGAQQDTGAAQRALASIQEQLKQRPTDATLLFHLARLRCQSGDIAGCVSALDEADRHGDGLLPAKADGFEKAWSDSGFQRVRAHMEARLPRLDFAPTAIEVEDRTIIPEGIAYDAPSNAFFIGSTAQGRIVRVGFGNALSDFATRQEGLDAILGLAVDAPRRLLYAVGTSALNADGRKRLGNAILAFDIDKARLVRRVDVPDAVQLNDVTVAIGGRVFASDSGSGAVFEIPREGAVRTLVPANTLPGANGLAASPDGKRLYVAHSTGLALVDSASGSVQRIENTTRESVGAIDGLYSYQGDLIGVQNVTTPGRVIAISLSPDGTKVTRVKTLLSHHHNALDEPTTGAVTDHGFFLLAATGVRHLSDNGGIDHPETVPNPIVLRVLLPR